MESISTAPIAAPLPTSIISTTGPQNKDNSDHECPICHETTSSTALTLVHSTCGNWFDDECLRTWISEGSTNTCPMCRETLGFAELPTNNSEIIALPRRMKLEAIRNKRRARVEPTEYHIRRTFRGALALLEEKLPLSRQDLLDSIDGELKLSIYALEFDDEDEDDDPFPLTTAPELLENFSGSHDLKSIRELWTAQRICSDYSFFLLQMEEAPHIGIWMPFPADIEIVDSYTALIETIGTSAYWQRQEWGPWALSVPVTTDFLCARFNALNGPRTLDKPHMRKLRDIAMTQGVSHWWIVEIIEDDGEIDAEGETPPLTQVYAVPWPFHSVVHGYHTLSYPGWVDNSPVYDPRLYRGKERLFLSRFIAAQVLTPFSRASLDIKDLMSTTRAGFAGKSAYRFSPEMFCWKCLVKRNKSPLEEWERYPILFLGKDSIIDPSTMKEKLNLPVSLHWCQDAVNRHLRGCEKDKVAKEFEGDRKEVFTGDFRRLPGVTVKPLGQRFRSDSLPNPNALTGMDKRQW
jgi:hypothetical protein